MAKFDKSLLKSAIIKEYEKCIKNPMYFFKKYVKIQNPVKGTVNFELYDFQEKALKDIVENRYTIILKARQMGISTLVAAYSLYLMTFFKDKNILVISITQETAKEIVTRVRFANDNLPSFLKKKAIEDNRLSLRLENGSQIKAASANSSAGRSSALSFLIIDECAFIPNINDIWTSAQPTLSLGGKACLLSTPFGTSTFFHKMWVEAEAGSNGFKPIKLPWYLHPERDKKWREEQTLKVGEKQAAQENDCDFITTGATVIPLPILQKYEKDKNFIHDPIERRGQMLDLWIWERVQPGKQYIVAADCARGDGEDNSAFHVLDVKTMEQVAEYRGKLTTKLYGDLLVAIATEYNDALLIIENNNIGWATIQQVIDRNYNNLFYSSANLTLVDTEKSYSYNWTAEDRKKVAGFSTTNQNRQLLINNMGLLVCNMELGLHSQRLINELTTFIWKDGKAQAMKGHNDDLVMAYAIGLWIRNTALRIMAQERTYQEAMLKAFRVSTMRADQFKDAKKSFNSFNNLENNMRLYDKNYAQSTWDFSIRENIPQQAMINSFYRPNVLGILNNTQNNNIFDLKELL